MEELLVCAISARWNKRVAFAMTDVFLRVNGYRIKADTASIHAKMMSMFEARTFDLAHVTPWLSTIVEPVATSSGQ